MSTYYLFFDYDNTVRVDGVVSVATVNAMCAAQKEGHKLILCTGRARGSVIEDFEKIPWDAVINGGCDITVGGKCIEERIVAPTDIRAWVIFSMRYHLFFIYEGQREIKRYHFEEHTDPYTDAEIEEQVAEILQMSRENPATKFSILGDRFDSSLFPKTSMNPIIHPSYVEVFGIGCDKGQAIRRFCELSGVSISSCVCFGDSMNDYAMFEACPVSICMKNSPAELAKIATYEARTKEGVAEGLSWFLGKGEKT